MKPEKKQIEILLMHYFRDCHAHFPKGKLVPSESPDFILKLKTRNSVGIELTRLKPVNTFIYEKNLPEYIEEQVQIITLVKSLFEKSSQQKLFVKFLFSDKIDLDDEKKVMISLQITNVIRNAVGQKEPDEFFSILLEGTFLPPVLESILIINHPVMKVSVWERSNNLGISNNVPDDVKAAILKKDAKLRLYHRQSLNYYWLVITTDMLRGTRNYNLHDKIINHVFESRFQNVFLFDLIGAKVLQLV